MPKRQESLACPISQALVWALFSCVQAGPAQAAAIGPETLAVVVNTADPVSVATAEYYIARRGIPRKNVIRIRLEPVQSTLNPRQYDELRSAVGQQTRPYVQAYVLTWVQPFRTACMSITTAFASGFDDSYCTTGCALSKPSPYFDSDSSEPYDDLKWRPTMSLAAVDVTQAKLLIDRGLAADGTRPRGTGYLLRTSDKRRNVRAAGFRGAVEELGGAVALRYVEADFIEGRDDVLFYFTGTKEVEHLTDNRFLPGAIADHLTSGGGRLVGGKQMSALRWLEAGATASYGTVEEPCAIPQKFPTPAIAIRRYLAGETMLEAYAKSVEMPAQGIFVGEPLARPYPKQQRRP